MRLRAITVEGKFYYFDFKDCPVDINGKLTVLINKPNSPLLLSRTISRGTAVEVDGEWVEVFETDFVSLKPSLKFLGFVIYKDGFCIYNRHTGDMTPLRNVENYIIGQNLLQYKLDEIKGIRSCIRLHYNGLLFRLNRIMFAKDNELFIDLKSSRMHIKLDEVNMCTGIERGKTEVYYGQALGSAIVELHDFHPMLKLSDGSYREITEEDFE